jgi:hypothetical protein
MTGYVPIYVPEAHFREMLDRLVSLMSELQAAPHMPADAQVESRVSAETESGAPAEHSHAWGDDVWQWVWPNVTDNARKLLVELAEHEGQWVPITSLEDSLGSFNAVQSGLSSLTKRAKKRGEYRWPFRVKEDRETGRATYQMNEAMAKIVLRLPRVEAGD